MTVVKNQNFAQIFGKNHSFDETLEFNSKIKILVKNLNFDEQSEFFQEFFPEFFQKIYLY